LDAEIVSMDSMALYKRMDIGTAKPTEEQRMAVAHHLVDVIEPWEEYSLAQYLAASEKCVADIAERNKRTLFVGGTPLYLKGLLRGIFEGPSADADYRRMVQEEADRREPLWLHSELQKVDPAAAARLHPNDQRRIVRALEVHRCTGRPISDWQKQFDVGLPAERCRVFVLDWPREELCLRIDQRVDEMFSRGLVEEVRGLAGGISPSAAGQRIDRPTLMSKTARQGVGYREVLDHLEGRASLQETVELVKIHTRQLAKRQGTWFRSLSECRFVPMHSERGEEAVSEILRLGRFGEPS
jgi:tRNA dimethylallyltransferase